MSFVYEILSLDELYARTQQEHPYSFKHSGAFIKYFRLPLRWGTASKSEYFFLLCRGDAPISMDDVGFDGSDMPFSYTFQGTPVYGVLELQTSPFVPDEMWLKYISVHPGFKSRGIGTQLAKNACAFLKGSQFKLSRSRSSEDEGAKIKRVIDNLLDGAGIPWTQTGQS